MKSKTQSILSSLILRIALIVILNLVGTYLYLRLDFSRGKIYTLGKTSKEAVRTLEDNFVVKVFASADLPADFRSMDRYLRDLLNEYSLFSRNRFRFEYVDNTNKEAFRNQAIMNELSYNVVPTYENDQMAFKEVVYGLTFEYQNKREFINLSSNLESRLEYEITSIVRTLTNAQLPAIAVYRDSTYSYLSTENFERALSRSYTAYETDLNFIDPRAKVLLFTGLVDSLSMNQLYQIDQFLMHGGKMVVLQERVPLYFDPLADIDSNFFDLLEHYGIVVMKNLVLDLVCDIQQLGMYDRVPFPVFPIARGTDHIVTRNMNNLVMYLVSEIAPAFESEDISFQPLARTSFNSALMTGTDYDLESFIMRRPTPEMFPMPPVTVGAILEGKFRSFFADEDYDLPEGFISEVKDGGIIIFGDRELVVDIDNALFRNRWFSVLNAVDFFLENESMIKVRSRSVQSSVFNIKIYLEGLDRLYFDINKLEQSIKMGIKVVSIVLPSLLLLIMGLYVYLRQKSYRRRIAELYEKA